MKASKKKPVQPSNNNDLDTVVDLQELEMAARENVNVLLTGRKGVGKTHIALSVLERAGKKVKYLSASTIDPYIHFVGIPKKSEVNDFFSMALPDWFEQGYDCLLIDELGRARTSVTNALFELIQFGTMHGKDLGIKVVWAANNPHDDIEEHYDVQPLDPALLDRFIVKIEVPYKCDRKYFFEKYGNLGLAAVSYWENNLNEAQRLDFSPRLLDNAVTYFRKGFDLKNIVPNKGAGAIVSSELMLVLEQALPTEEILARLVKSGDVEKAREYINKENNYSLAKNIILADKNLINYFIPLMDLENVASIITEIAVAKHVLENFTQYPENLLEVLKANSELNHLYTNHINARVHELLVEDYTPFTIDILPKNLPNISDLNEMLHLISRKNVPCSETITYIAGYVKHNPKCLDDSQTALTLWDKFSETCLDIKLEDMSNTRVMICLHGILVGAYSRHSNKRPIYVSGILSDDDSVVRQSQLMTALGLFCNKQVWEKLNELTVKK